MFRSPVDMLAYGNTTEPTAKAHLTGLFRRYGLPGQRLVDIDGDTT
jgi:hypothetical protein